MIKGVIFDLDGTLLYTLKDLNNAVNYALKNKNKAENDLLTTRKNVGNGIKKLIIRSLNETEEKIVNDALIDFKNHYKEHILDNTVCYKNVIETLSILREKNIKIAIVSNKYQEGLNKLCNHFFKDYSDIFIGDNKGIPLKPNKDMVEIALNKMSLKNDECIFVGDSSVDIQTAKNCEMKIVAMNYGYQDKDVLESLNPDYLIDDMIDLVNIIKKENNNE